MLKASLYLDTRRPLKDGKYPLKLHVSENSKLRNYYSTGESLSEADWEAIKSLKLRSRELRKAHSRIFEFEARARAIITADPYLTLKQFDALFTGRRTHSTLVKDLYDEKIKDLVKRGQYGTSTIYQSAINMLDEKRPGLSLQTITKDFLVDLEHELTIAPSTKGIYLRTLRTIVNMAIDRKLCKREFYPFGSRQYSIPTSRNHKRALSEPEKNKLVSYQPEISEWKAALRVWKFSYYANGMNCSDIALLKPTDVHGDVITYTRRKTVRTERVAKKQVVTIGEPLAKILEDGLFQVLEGTESPRDEKRKILQWIKTTNKYLVRIGEKLELPIRLTTYTARHTAATMLLLNGANLAYIKEALGHSSIQTTENYLSSLNLEEQRKMTAKL